MTKELVARFATGTALQPDGTPFPTLAAYTALAPTLLLWSDGSVTWARTTPIPDDARNADA